MFLSVTKRLLFPLTVLLSLGFSCAVNSSEVDDFSEWLKELHTEALTLGISQATLQASLEGVTLIARVIELDRNQPEFTLTSKQYLERVVPSSRVATGRKLFSEHQKLLSRIGRKYGVQPRFIVALWGIETDFGQNTGGFSVISSLATLAYDGRRSEFFRTELLNALKIIDDGHITPGDMIGSWAGAMGQNQFMPSSFLNFAVDEDGDGRRDIWNTKEDIFASTANYLSRSGWRDDQTWGRQVQLPDRLDESLIGLSVIKKLGEWQQLGVRRADGSALPTRQLPASLVLPDGIKGPAFLVYNNYRTTLKWNRSTFFALAVGALADGIVEY